MHGEKVHGVAGALCVWPLVSCVGPKSGAWWRSQSRSSSGESLLKRKISGIRTGIADPREKFLEAHFV